ncbi:MAG TPA: hypothetical protein VFA68_19245 [Terriglobales bacterium]|nr:hypothetical protein [Terriglobales bacterium]
MRNVVLFLAVVSASLCVNAQTPRVERQKEFAASLPAVKGALQNLGAYGGSRLPSLDGFVNLDGIQPADFQRPYYEYKIDLEPSSTKGTVVKVRAQVSAWYAGRNGEAAGYRNFESNGRLEADLLDRLSQYLIDKSDDPKVLSENVEKVRAQRIEAERQLATLAEQVKASQQPKGISEGTEFALVSQAQVKVYSAPAENSKVLVHAHLDDEFQVLEQHGPWVRVALSSSQSGWIKRAQVEVSSARAIGAVGQAASIAPGFTILRRNEDVFEGDWQKLKGRKALYLFAQPDGSAMNAAVGDRWKFVQSVFGEQYREMAHTPQNTIEGVVIIFMDQGGGVAAASLDDIRAWMEGTLTKSEFIRRCSLDPPAAFLKPEPGEPGTGKRHSSLSSAKNPPRS